MKTKLRAFLCPMCNHDRFERILPHPKEDCLTLVCSECQAPTLLKKDEGLQEMMFFVQGKEG